jgi:CRP-like cAMP-binding protein
MYHAYKVDPFYKVRQSLFQLTQLTPALRASISYRNLLPGEFLFKQGEPSETIFALESGQVRLQHFTKTGQQISCYAVHPGEYFAEATLFTNTYIWTAVAEQQSRVAMLPKSVFLQALQQDAGLALSFITQACHHLQTATILMELRGMHSARERVMSYLEHFLIPPNDTVYLDRPLKDVASDLNLTPEALSRTLKQFQEEGIISRSRNIIKIL